MVGSAVRYVLDEILDTASEVSAQFVEHVRLNVRAMLIHQLGKGHPTQTGGCSDFLQLYPPAFAEFEFCDPFLEFEP